MNEKYFLWKTSHYNELSFVGRVKHVRLVHSNFPVLWLQAADKILFMASKDTTKFRKGEQQNDVAWILDIKLDSIRCLSDYLQLSELVSASESVGCFSKARIVF